MSTYQHGGSKIELMEELRDEDVDFEDIGDILPLYVTKDVDKPLEVLVRRTYPEEIHLSNRYTVVM